MENQLKKLRLESNLSLGQLSAELEDKGVKIGRASLNNYERGDQEPSLKTWQILADYFGVSVAYLIGIDSLEGKNEIIISRSEYLFLKEIEKKYYEIRALVN